MDWNWFYSTLSQSSAAIVGIISGFVITRITTNISAYNSRIKEYESLIQLSNKLQHAAYDRFFTWYNVQCANGVLYKIEKEVKDKYEDIHGASLKEKMQSCFYKYSFSPYMPYEEAIPLIQQAFALGREASRNGSSTSPATIYDHEYRVALKDERDKINMLRQDVEVHLDKVTTFLRESSSYPESSNILKYVIYACILLFAAGVATPLIMLPSYSNISGIITNTIPVADGNIDKSLKIITITVVSILYVVILIMLLISNKSLRLSDRSKLERRLELKFYSPYLSAYDNNLKERDIYIKSTLNNP